MTALEYIQKLNEICKQEFISRSALARELGVATNTVDRVFRNAEPTSFKTLRKIKTFVDGWEAKNMSGSD